MLNDAICYNQCLKYLLCACKHTLSWNPIHLYFKNTGMYRTKIPGGKFVNQITSHNRRQFLYRIRNMIHWVSMWPEDSTWKQGIPGKGQGPGLCFNSLCENINSSGLPGFSFLESKFLHSARVLFF